MVLTRDCTKTRCEPQKTCPSDRDGQVLHSTDAHRAEWSNTPHRSRGFSGLGLVLHQPPCSIARLQLCIGRNGYPGHLFSDLTIKQRACFSTVPCSYISQHRIGRKCCHPYFAQFKWLGKVGSNGVVTYFALVILGELVFLTQICHHCAEQLTLNSKFLTMQSGLKEIPSNHMNPFWLASSAAFYYLLINWYYTAE